jgi:hypothetical protein
MEIFCFALPEDGVKWMAGRHVERLAMVRRKIQSGIGDSVRATASPVG